MGLSRLLIAVAVVIAGVGSVEAQHPCDQPDQTAATKATRVGFCISPEDLQGVEWKLVIGNSTYSLPVTSPTTTPSASGLYYVEGPMPGGYGKGLYQVQIYGISAEGSGPLSDVRVWQIGGPPAKPIRPQLVARLIRPMVLAFRR